MLGIGREDKAIVLDTESRVVYGVECFSEFKVGMREPVLDDPYDNA
jgi:hypothetical protein